MERSVYNKRLRRLSFKIEEVRQEIVSKMAPKSEMYIVDSMPSEVCKLSRAVRSKTCQEDEARAPNFGFCAA